MRGARTGAWPGLDALFLLLVVGAVLGGGAVAHRSLSAMREELPLQVMRESEALFAVIGDFSMLVHESKEAGQDADPRVVKEVRASLERVRHGLRVVRETYNLDSLVGSARIHAIINPAVEDVLRWLDHGLYGAPADSPALWRLVNVRLAAAERRAGREFRASQRLALEQLAAERAGLARLQSLVRFFLVGFALCAAALVAFYLRQRRAERRAALAHRRLHEAIASIPDGFALFDAGGRLALHNQAFCELAPLPREAVPGRARLRDLLADLEAEPPAAPGGARPPQSSGARIWRGRGRDVRIMARPSGDGGTVVVLTDVTDLSEAERRLRHLAAHDPLTGLLNRREFESRLERAVDSTRRTGASHVLCYVDLDRFKLVNDSCGHAAGDELLRRLAGALRARIRQRDTLARIGGDEFAILIEHCTVSVARPIAESLVRCVEELPFTWQGKAFRVGASIGLVGLDASDVTPAELLEHADAACYAAKTRAGGDPVHVHATGEDEAPADAGEPDRAAEVRAALATDRFVLYVQRIDRTSDPPPGGRRCARHLEVLVRMLDHGGSPILPRAFLPAAERHGLSVAIDRWVIERLLSWRAAHPDEAAARVYHVNLSPAALRNRDFLDFLRARLAGRANRSDRLCFEIPEHAIIAHPEPARALLEMLRELGCAVAVEGFGHGLYSFAYLRDLPVEYLKIDPVIVKGAGDDELALAMVRAINALAHGTGKRTVAARVEDQALLAKLLAAGVDYHQGHVAEPPRPLA